MRAFVAIDIPQEVRREIIKIQAALPELKGKKTEQENLHLTLKFLGEVDEKDIEQIKKKLKEIKFNSFETEIDSLGIFHPKLIRIVWLHMNNCDALQKEIDEKLSPIFEPERRFMSHLTIARVKSIKDKNIFLEKIKKIKFDKIKLKVKNFKLKRSKLTRNGSVYEDLEIYDLV
ncbi:RNA 2',3'-cyclic phosphodiesterase [Candidatus Pacearchaeota archaeon]|nr:RNA 2',3'-cyclic phosphodiesterase [Candidatus Pacearchaeota archaeon]